MFVLQGIVAVPGVITGKVQWLSLTDDLVLHHYVQAAQDEEAKKYNLAHTASVQEVALIVETAKKDKRTEQAEIMEAHLGIMSDPVLAENILAKIGQGASAPVAVKDTVEEIAQMFAGLENPYLRERATDVRDVGSRIVRALLGIKPTEFNASGIILCAADILPSVVAGLPRDKVVGLLLGQGSLTSHAVIMAKALGLPTLVGLGEQVQQIADGATAILDATNGQLIVSPAGEQLAAYGEKIKHEQGEQAQHMSRAQLPATTNDGKRIVVAANIGQPAEIVAAAHHGGEGVGLFRTEFLFMGRDSLPNEQEQFEAYKFVIEKCKGHLCVIRTLDIGGDKPLPYLAIPKEDNPFLGWRAIRISLKRTDIFRTQLRAILRAAAFGKTAIMLPMIVSISEIVQTKALLAQARAELYEEGEYVPADIPLGIMVETPAAAVMAHELAKECDFFSIGTNDLVQYTLAADRGNQNVSYLFDHFHPAVLRLIAMTVRAAHASKIWVGVCGEMAGDPLATKLLISLGVDELSMSAPAIPKIKHIISSIQSDDTHARNILSLEGVERVREYLQQL